MTGQRRGHAAAPRQPPAGLPGLDPAWSHTIDVVGQDGVAHQWHVLDSDPAAPPTQPTLLCVHGNPTWSYLWRRLLAAAPPGWRVVAPDQLGMGYSERLAAPRRLAERVSDLDALTAAMGLTGPVVTVAHDWGGIISLGWALGHRDQVRGVVLTNTAVHQPDDTRAPALIRLAHLRVLREALCVRTPIFVRAATVLSRPPLPREVRRAFAAPYRGAARRRSVGDFVADIPFGARDASQAALEAISDGVDDLEVPALLLWGPRDPVFGEQYLRDLRARLPQADVHRYEGAAHLLPEDAPGYAVDIATWATPLGGSTGRPSSPRRPSAPARPSAPEAFGASPPAEPGGAPDLADAGEVDVPVWAALEARAAASPHEVAAAEVGGSSITWRELDRRVRATAAGLRAAGVGTGDRVALLVPPSIELTVAVYAVWRAAAVIVVADKGLGLRGMGRALRGAQVDHVIGSRAGLAAARAMRVPGTRLLAGIAPAGVRRGLRASATLAELAHRGATAPAGPPGADPPPADPLPAFSGQAEAAVVFTSGATGPAKGVVYRHAQVQAQLAVLRATYALSASDRIVAAFAPFALYGPALGVASAVPDTDVTAAATLTAAALADAVSAIDATVVFASPAALRNVVRTAGDISAGQRHALGRVRLLMSAGAPVPLTLLRSLGDLVPGAALHTPYGMTEVLPVTDVALDELEHAGPGDGVCVGRPLPGVSVAISPLDGLGRADGELTSDPYRSGEICVRAAHVKDRYDALWATERCSSRTTGWHRTGDVGYLDRQRRLWLQGRLPHLITTASGVVTPVGLEQRVEAVAAVRAAAVVGVGPPGTQQVVVVVVPDGRSPRRRAPVADLKLTDAVRAAVEVPVAAVLVIDRLPVDVRHAAKVDRCELADWAAKVLAGRM